MSYNIQLVRREAVKVDYLKVEAQVRYWEDATVNGQQDSDDNPTIPCRRGDMWCPTINLATGKIDGWPIGVTADVHYKVCDAGCYTLLDASGSAVKTLDGYVPRMMCPAENGYGDYIIMHIGEDGQIDKWKVDLAAFEDDDTP